MLPVPISEGTSGKSLPTYSVEIAKQTHYFLAENAKTSRAFLKEIGHPEPISSLSIIEIGHRPDLSSIEQWLTPLSQGHDIVVISEAGCPGIADPGAQIAAYAQSHNYKVVPLVGPCSIVLALMASGMDGQNFRFCGYLPIKEPDRSESIKTLERLSSRGETQLFIETPYRNESMLYDLLKNCAPTTKILVATDVTGENEYIKTKTCAQWKKQREKLSKLPTVFAVLAALHTKKHR